MTIAGGVMKQQIKKFSRFFLLSFTVLHFISIIIIGSIEPTNQFVNIPSEIVSVEQLHDEQRPLMESVDVRKKKIDTYVQAIVSKYPHNVDEDTARVIVETAMKYEKKTFPRVIDIIAIIDIESSFRPHVKSSLSYDPAVGLMQVRPGIWKINKKELETIEGQIAHGSRILTEYHQQIGNIYGTVMAYNIGITAYKNGNKNYNYLAKYKRELQRYYVEVYQNIPRSLPSK